MFKQIYLLVTRSDPTIENGQITPSQLVYIVSDVIHVSCDIGYYLNGGNTSTCQSSLQWQPHIPSCIQGNRKDNYNIKIYFV